MVTIIAACITALATIVSGPFAARISRDKTPYNVLDVIEIIPEGCKEKKRLTNWLISNELWKFSDGSMHSTTKFFLLLILFFVVTPLLFWLVVGVANSVNNEAVSLTQYLMADLGYVCFSLTFVFIVFLGLIWLESVKRRDIKKIKMGLGAADTYPSCKSGISSFLQERENMGNRVVGIVALVASCLISVVALIACSIIVSSVGVPFVVYFILCFVPFLLVSYWALR